MVEHGGRGRSREAGKARAEGKDYIVKDGDVILFLQQTKTRLLWSCR